MHQFSQFNQTSNISVKKTDHSRLNYTMLARFHLVYYSTHLFCTSHSSVPAGIPKSNFNNSFSNILSSQHSYKCFCHVFKSFSHCFPIHQFSLQSNRVIYYSTIPLIRQNNRFSFPFTTAKYSKSSTPATCDHSKELE